MSRDEAIKRLKAEIQERVSALAALEAEAEAEAVFVPGRSPVRYAGRVYGAPELSNLTAATLEFWLTAGRWHRRLEYELARYYQLPFARLVNSGSSANLLATAALTSHLWGDRRVRPGDEVVTVAAGFPTTVAPAMQLGLVPVFVDITVPTYNIDVSQLEAARSSRTRAVMIAHTLGNPFDLSTVKAFCEKHGLWLIEDNCDAAGSRYDGQMTGTFGDLATLSFYPPHHMTTGEGGAVLCADDTMLKVVESLRDWGRDCWCASGVDNTCGKRFGWQLGALPRGYDHKYTYSHLGFNLKMTDMQASVGVAQLDRLDSFGAKRRENWQYFRDALRPVEDVLLLPEATPKSDPSWFGFLMLVREEASFTRDELVQHLEMRKIQTRMLFAGNLTRQPALTELARDRAARGEPPPFRVVAPLDTTDRVMARAFWVGVYPGLTEAMRGYVVETILDFVARRRQRGRVSLSVVA